MQELGEAAKIFVYLELFKTMFKLVLMAGIVLAILWRIYAK
jgi:hypothetical protein